MPRSKNYDRDEILERAMNTFWIKGYSATSINDLVKETGINRFSIYKEFENKDALYLESFEKYKHVVIESRMSALEQDSDGIECLRRFFMAYIKGVKKGLKSSVQPVSCLTVMNATESIGCEPNSSKIMNRILKRMQQTFETVLRRAVEKKEITIKADLHQYALLLVGCTYGLDIMSKFLSVKELTAYVNQVLVSLK